MALVTPRLARLGLVPVLLLAFHAHSAVAPGPPPAVVITQAQASTSSEQSGVSSEEPASRNPLLWPYPQRSIWNWPIGDRADLVPLPVAPPTVRTLAIEEDILIMSPHGDQQELLGHDAGWRSGDRCGSRTGEVLHHGLPIDGSFRMQDVENGTPNHSAAIVMPDLTLFETQPLHVCADGAVVSQRAAPIWRGSSIISGATPEDPGQGSHGGSDLTAFGGTIRLGEWVPGGRIPHVIKIEVDAQRYLSRSASGYRWPASTADRYFASRYSGQVPGARMGALLALPATFDVESLSSEPGRILAATLRDYGAYVVDDTARDAVAFATEWSPTGRVRDEFENVWGFPLSGRLQESVGPQRQFLSDLTVIYGDLHVVDDNGPTSVGGAGSRLAPLAPPFRHLIATPPNSPELPL